MIRYQRFDTAFRLAIDLGDRDLFLDLFHCARGVGEETLAQAARQKVAELEETEHSASASVSSSSKNLHIKLICIFKNKIAHSVSAKLKKKVKKKKFYNAVTPKKLYISQNKKIYCMLSGDGKIN